MSQPLAALAASDTGHETPERSDPVRVVVYTSGPRLESAAAEFIVRLDDHAEIELLAVFHETAGSTLYAVVADLWRRRGLLALPVFALQALRSAARYVRRPRHEIRLRRRIAELSECIRRVPDIHDARVVEHNRELAPQLGLIYGAPILRPALFEIPTLGTLGIHHGRLPEYRGKKTTFWAMYHGEPSAGVTIQRVNAGLDTGEVVRAGDVAIGRAPLGSVWRQLEALGLDLYIQAILEMKHGTATFRKPEGPRGRLFGDPTLADILTFWRRYAGRLLRNPEAAPPRSTPGICMLTETFYPLVGGGETQTRVLAEGLAGQGYAVSVVTRRSTPTWKKMEYLGPIRLYRLAPAGSGHLKKWGLLFTGFVALVRLRRQYDLLFVSGFRVLGIPAVLASRLFGRPCILKADSLGEMSGEFFHRGLQQLGLRPSFWPFRVFVSLRNRLLRCCNGFVAISSAVEREYLANGVDPSAIERIPNGVDTERFSPPGPQLKEALRNRLQIPRSARVVIFTGRLVRYKGLPLLVRVWEEIQRRRPDALLLLVGSGGLDLDNWEDSLRSEVAERGLQQSIRFTGAVENVHEYLQASDIFVFPTEQEAFGLSLVEAMACGLPAIATPVGAVEEILAGGENGRIVAAGSYDQLLEALDAMLADPSLALELGQKGRRAVEECYAIDVVLKHYSERFASLREARDR